MRSIGKTDGEKSKPAFSDRLSFILQKYLLCPLLGGDQFLLCLPEVLLFQRFQSICDGIEQ